MRHVLTGVAICLSAFGWANPTVAAPDQGEEAKELKRLEGVWISTPSKKGRDRGHVIAFRGGKLGWKSFQTQDGKPVIGHSKLYEVRLDPKASPKQITLLRGEGEDKETRLGIYELEGDRLKIGFAVRDEARPEKFGEDGARALVLNRDKGAKLPNLEPPGKPVQVRPRAHWLGTVGDAAVRKRCPDKPVTNRTDFEKLWTLLRAGEVVPKVDFDTEFIVVKTSDSPVTDFYVELMDGVEEADTVIVVGFGEVKGFAYFIAVFRRSEVDVVGGRVVRKKAKK